MRTWVRHAAVFAFLLTAIACKRSTPSVLPVYDLIAATATPGDIRAIELLSDGTVVDKSIASDAERFPCELLSTPNAVYALMRARDSWSSNGVVSLNVHSGEFKEQIQGGPLSGVVSATATVGNWMFCVVGDQLLQIDAANAALKLIPTDRLNPDGGLAAAGDLLVFHKRSGELCAFDPKSGVTTSCDKVRRDKFVLVGGIDGAVVVRFPSHVGRHAEVLIIREPETRAIRELTQSVRESSGTPAGVHQDNRRTIVWWYDELQNLTTVKDTSSGQCWTLNGLAIKSFSTRHHP